MIGTRQVGRGGRVRVTFTLPADGDGDGDGDGVSVVGVFNDWDPGALRMRRRGSTRAASVELDSGRRYAFRYVTAEGEWFDDDNVSEYEPNGFGGSNGVIDLTAGA